MTGILKCCRRKLIKFIFIVKHFFFCFEAETIIVFERLGFNYGFLYKITETVAEDLKYVAFKDVYTFLFAC